MDGKSGLFARRENGRPLSALLFWMVRAPGTLGCASGWKHCSDTPHQPDPSQTTQSLAAQVTLKLELH